ncbi:hypothetical protein [Bacillus atrophaeus]|uniref:hypothetical protein n=1 Tax=Bacillus atrophaeus TaxID=1452 RepID=UPI00227FE0D5|nr:hypothetical protein [Bacillus atrophaeus]MCY8506484.1 hypothetical protein [Bacillus atrophaeus]MCY8950897.1 hypothetical protein [Bacillus atrophaeus]MCY8967783.1 hypothetical protein [Bacillus atrophaeus]
MKSNALMKNYLSQINTVDIQVNIYELIKDIIPDIIEWDDCILIKNIDNMNLPDQFTPNNFIRNKSEYENTHNHFHLEDYLDEGISPLELITIAAKLISVLESTLKEKFPHKIFFILVSFNEEDLDCTIRFHSVREEEKNALDEDLESYSEALLVSII